MRVVGSTIIAVVLCQICATTAIDNLRVAFQWKQIDYEWTGDYTKTLFPDYKQADNLPLGLEVAGNRLFITVPRWKRGVASSLNFIKINDTRKSPPLTPYPSWEEHLYTRSGVPEIVSPFRIRADKCNRLWVVDSGLVDIIGTPEQLAPPALLIYDLTNDELIRKYTIPDNQKTTDSLFANIAVEDKSCDDTYAYIGDLGGPGLVVYSWKRQTSWLVKHNYFYPDPMGGVFNVSGISFTWTDGIFGMALAPHAHDEFSTLYFHPLSSTMEFAVSTKTLRDPARVNSPEVYREFKVLGSRGPNGQSSVSFLDPKTGILFYALANLNAIACWRTGANYTIQQQGRIYMNNITMVFPNDLKIDSKSNIWVLSDRLPVFMYSELNFNDYNFRVLTGNVEEAIQGTICAMKTPGSTMFDTRPGTSSKDVMDIDNRIDSGPNRQAKTSGSNVPTMMNSMITIAILISRLFV